MGKRNVLLTLFSAALLILIAGCAGSRDIRMQSINPVVFENSKAAAPKEKKFLVAIDAGHGGKDHGARGYWGTTEKIIAFRLAKYIQKTVEKKQGERVEARLIREDDRFLPLLERARIANQWGADMFISIHANSSPIPKAQGFELYFLSQEATDEAASKLALVENSEISPVEKPQMPAEVWSILSDAQTNVHINDSAKLAETVFGEMTQRMLSNGRAVRQAPFTVLHGTSMPSILIEIGYVTHPIEAKRLLRNDYLFSAANAINSGIEKFLAQRKRLG